MTEYIEPDDVDEWVDHAGFVYRDRGLMLSALASPLPVFGEEVYPGLNLKAAVLLSAINHNHPLLDGNKRLSWVITGAFYELNGHDLVVPQREIDRQVRAVAAGKLDLAGVQDWLDKHTRPR